MDQFLLECSSRGDNDTSPMQFISSELLAYYRDLERELLLLKGTPGALKPATGPGAAGEG